ncbi:hypothetical protein AsFPU1_2910 [Aphanothece sacrum FPU1]|uniref:DUF29 domain-containing protein n=1 Tax=Aphanothece sacrum FPU1 TaxID=1920663 RepID=A0A401IJV4_APHSA|nr:hypothetical protein AsFPU1_2910 [Aphanothece sacrum FPU1]GBF86403.1 hypothetical protein AsFPU3_3474 [Aphanothece sacrum FPU3]
MTTEIYQFDCKLYDQDFLLWLETTINNLQKRQLSRLDYDNLIEELSAMGRKEKHALESNLIIILLHLLKWQYQPEKKRTVGNILLLNIDEDWKDN